MKAGDAALKGKWVVLRADAKVTKIGGKWGSNGISVMGHMGINLQLVDAIHTGSEG